MIDEELSKILPLKVPEEIYELLRGIPEGDIGRLRRELIERRIYAYDIVYGLLALRRFSDILGLIGDNLTGRSRLNSDMYRRLNYAIYTVLIQVSIPELERDPRVIEIFKEEMDRHSLNFKDSDSLSNLLYYSQNWDRLHAYIDRISDLLGEDYAIDLLEKAGFFDSKNVDEVVENYMTSEFTPRERKIKLAENFLAERFSRSNPVFKKIFEKALTSGMFGLEWESEVAENYEDLKEGVDLEKDFLHTMMMVLEDSGFKISNSKELSSGGIISFSNGRGVRGIYSKQKSFVIFGHGGLKDKILEFKLSNDQIDYKIIDSLVNLLSKLNKYYNRGTEVQDLEAWLKELVPSYSQTNFKVEEDHFSYKQISYYPSGDFELDDTMLDYLEHGFYSGRRLQVAKRMTLRQGMLYLATRGR